MIPAEAVEAAARKLYQASGLTVWDKEDESTRNFYRRNAKSALEAAAPHMMAEVLEEAACAAEDPSPEDMDTYFIDQADVGRWLRDRAKNLRDTK